MLSEKERLKYVELLKKLLTEYRFKHSLNVSAEAVRLAERYGGDVDKAEFAGLMHDVMKDVGKDEQLRLMREYCVDLNEVERREPKLWHAIAGAVYLENTLGISDRDILNAVRYHTTGRAGMSLLEKIIYIADFTSAERDYKGVEEIRAAADRGLEVAMEETLSFSVKDLVKKRCPIEPHTFEAYNELILTR